MNCLISFDFILPLAKMPRTYVRKTDRDPPDSNRMKEAVDAVIKNNISIRKAAERFDIKASTLHR